MTNGAKFTPGPWDVHETSQGLEIHPLSDEHGLIVIADVQGAPQNEANARLIASAPELLEALQEAVDCLKHGEYHATLKMAQAAIAKATGGQL